MDYKQYYADLSGKRLPNLLLFDGEEEYVKESALEALRKSLLPEGMESLNETRFAEKTGVELLVDACETLPFLAEKRLVQVTDSPFCLSGRADGEEKALLAYLDRLPESCCLLFFVRGNADGKRALVKRVEAAGGRVRFDPLTPREQGSFVRRQLRAYDKTIEESALQSLLERSGPLLTAVNNQLQKLIAHAGDRQAVQLEDVEAVVQPSVEMVMYELLDAVVLKNKKKALLLLSELQKESGAFNQLALALARQLRWMYHTRLLMDAGQGAAQVAKTLGVSAYAARRRMEMAARFSAEEAWALLEGCVQAVYEVRAGLRAEDGALELLVFGMMERP